MKRLLFLLLVLVCSVTYGQTYQSMPQAGYGPVKRMLFDSVVTLPMGITSLRNISGGRDTAQIRYNKNDSSIYVYTGSQWVKSSGSGSTIDTTSLSNRINLKLNIVDTINQFVSSVSQPNDSSLTFVKGSTASTYVIRSATAGSATRLVTTVYNNTGATILKGAVVYISGRHSSNLPTIALAKGNNEANSYKTFALVDANIPTSSSGLVVQAGNITGLNLPTSTYTDGDIVYLSPTVAGGYTTTKPLAPYHICKLGSVTRAHPTFGAIEIKIENGWQLDELSDVQIASVPLDSTLLQFSRTDSLWHDVSINSAFGSRFSTKQDTATSWKTGGNFNVNAGQFIGSRNNASLRFRTNNTERFVIDSIGSVGIGTSLAAASSLVDITSTGKGLLIPRMTTTQRDAIGSPAVGLQVYNTTTNANDYYNGTAWVAGLTNGTQTIAGAKTFSSLVTFSNNTNGANYSFTQFLQNSAVALGTFNGIILLSGSSAPTTGTKRLYDNNITFAPTSGTSSLATFEDRNVYNQTGGANGITRGLYINPTLTSAADFRGLEVANGSIVLPYSAQTTTYAVKTSDYLINATSGTYTATLPTAVGCTGKNYIIKNSGTGVITVGTTSSQTIDGSTTYSLGTQYKYVHVVSNGANWIITANN